MAKSRLEADIPGIGSVAVTGNIATEEAIEDLIKAVETLSQKQQLETKDVQDGLDETTESLEEFDDEVLRATNSQKKLNKQMIDLVDRAEDVSRGFVRNVSSTASMSDMVETAGEIAAGFAGGLAGLIPFIGEGTARLAEATVQAGTALLSMAVGAVESFQEMNRSIMQGGLILEGGFSGLANAADIAGIPVNEFGQAVMANISRLRLLEGGAPGGLARISNGFKALQEAQEENLDTLYALGFSQQQVVSGMADVALGAQRAGRNLNNEELAAGTFDYLRNLQELSRLTGESAESIQAQVEANRSNLFVQNALLDVAPQYRDAAAQFAAAIPAALGPMRDFIVTGQSFSTESGLMVSQMGTFANLYRQAYEGVASGQISEEQARDQLASSLAANRSQIEAELASMTQAFGMAPDQAYADLLGGLGFTARQMIIAGEAFDPLSDLDGNNLSVTMGALAGAQEAARAAIQSTFVEGLDELSGEDGSLTRFAESMSGAAMGAEVFRDAVFAAMQGDFEAAAAALGIGGDTVPPASEGTQSSTADPNNPIEQLPGYDPNSLPGAADGDILTGPTSGYMAELHGTEAVVPLPDGRTIPVSLTTGGLNPNIIEALQTQSLAAAESVEQSVSSFSASLDNSRSLPELVNISKNMLSQMTLTAQRIELMIKAMDQANNINRNAAYVRA
jgi:hypothetical protein